MAKAKMMIKVEIEYEQNPEHYPDGSTPEEMRAIDLEGVEADPFIMMDSNEAVWSFSVDPVTE